MKSLFLVATMLFSASSFAVWNEVECQGRTADKTIQVNVEEAFPRGSSFQRANLVVYQDGNQTVEDYNGVIKRISRGMPRVTYQGSGLRLEVDLWPDNVPQWGRTYRASVRATALGRNEVRNLSCRFQNIR